MKTLKQIATLEQPRKPSIYSFSTLKHGKTRTVGIGCLLHTVPDKPHTWGENEILTLNNLFGCYESQGLAAAKGKFFLITIDRKNNTVSNACFQVKGNVAKEVFCGNATAAASLAIGRFLRKKSNIKFEYHCANIFVNITSNAIPKGDNIVNVSQIWETDTRGAALQHIKIENKEAVRFDFFNDWLVVKGPIRDLEKVLGEEVHTGNLAKKLALIYPKGNVPLVRFFNCNGLHGAAPQTGLASLAILATKVGWIKDCFPDNKLSTPSSVESLPEILSHRGDDISFVMSDVDVRLSKIF